MRGPAMPLRKSYYLSTGFAVGGGPGIDCENRVIQGCYFIDLVHAPLQNPTLGNDRALPLGWGHQAAERQSSGGKHKTCRES
ncbi:hypothetical protein SPHV1_50094 [Novosphingobium sp. KN65.2]|nr:hypothetical protein SPHV1_50094 [Novosphingobium sp. KN65.2]